MGRPRKVHVQVEITYRKRDKNQQFRGGARANAGRKPVGDRAGAPHRTRPRLDPRHPQHVTLRVTDAIGWLRRFDTFAALRRALRVVAKRHDFRIVHISVQNNHLHLICEASSKKSLARGLQSFQISAAKQLNAAISKRRRTERRGRVFTDRYHAEDLGTPRQVRNAVAYVINNWRRHGVDHNALFALHDGQLDPYASGLSFAGWREPLPVEPIAAPPGWEPAPVSEPWTWLLRVGWTKAPPISMREVPGPRKVAVVDA
jgi:REP element-mobilizing transposase RayT